MEGEYDLPTVLFCLCDEQSNITHCLLVQRTNKQEVKRQDGGVQLQCFVTDTAALGAFYVAYRIIQAVGNCLQFSWQQ